MKNFKKFASFLIWGGMFLTAFFTILFVFKTGEIHSGNINVSTFDGFGSLIGGVVGILFSLAGVLLILQTLKEQDEDFFNQKVESRFFELLHIHRENVKDMNLKGKVGHSAIIWMMRELFECLSIANHINRLCADNYRLQDMEDPIAEANLNVPYNEKEIINFAYLAFYFGCAGPSRANTFKEYVKDYKDDFVSRYIEYCNDERREIRTNKKFTFPLFSGHQLRLGHYYRHLYQTTKFINKISNDKVSYSSKYEYIKTLRAQMTTQEQVLLFFNSISKLGLSWELSETSENNKLITKYNLIKNIPHRYASDYELKNYYPNVVYEGDEKSSDRILLEKGYN